MRFHRVHLAWRSVTHDKRRFVLSMAGIMFAAVLMFMQLGFLNAVFDSQVELLRRLNADLVITNSSKHHLGVNEPFGRRRLEQVRAVDGVAAAYPLYIEGTISLWKNPVTRESRLIRAVGVRPEDHALLNVPLGQFLSELHEEDTALIDTRSKDFFGPRERGVHTELAGQRIRVVGTFELGTDFDYDGTVILSENNFLKFFPDQQTDPNGLGRVELGLIRVQPGRSASAVQKAIAETLPHDVRVWTKDEIIAQEIYFWQVFTPVGFVFGLGLIVGFIVGVVICSQILYTSVVDRMPLFGTLKAIGYSNAYLVRLVTSEALLLSLLSFAPAVAIAAVLYNFLVSIIGFEMFLNAERILLVMFLTVGMSMAAALIAVRKAVTADPAEVFK
jgi:putative ABC transport system permease protein